MANNYITLDDIQKYAQYLQKINEALKTQEFKDYLKKKSREVLDKITEQNLNADVEQKYEHTYRNNHKVEVDEEYITISNYTDISVDNINSELAKNYPNGFDLSKAVEYGTGLVGATSEASSYAKQDVWEYMVNDNRDYQKGWFYEVDGKVYWTKGMSGKLIFNKAEKEIEDKLYDWIDEYFDNI